VVLRAPEMHRVRIFLQEEGPPARPSLEILLPAPQPRGGPAPFRRQLLEGAGEAGIQLFSRTRTTNVTKWWAMARL
jgi:hypothetical protein